MQVPQQEQGVFAAMCVDGVLRQFYGPPPVCSMTVTIPAGMEGQITQAVNKCWVKFNKRNSRTPQQPQQESLRKSPIHQAKLCLQGAKLTSVPETRKRLCNKAERLLKEASEGEDSEDSEASTSVTRSANIEADLKTLDLELKSQRIANIAKSNAWKKTHRKTVVRDVGVDHKTIESVVTREEDPPQVLTMFEPLKSTAHRSRRAPSVERALESGAHGWSEPTRIHASKRLPESQFKPRPKGSTKIIPAYQPPRSLTPTKYKTKPCLERPDAWRAPRSPTRPPDQS